MNKLKMNVIENQILGRHEQRTIVGGSAAESSCGCACKYEGNGGSSTADNSSANAASGLHSPGMEKQEWILGDDGCWYPCDYWQ